MESSTFQSWVQANLGQERYRNWTCEVCTMTVPPARLSSINKPCERLVPIRRVTKWVQKWQGIQEIKYFMRGRYLPPSYRNGRYFELLEIVLYVISIYFLTWNISITYLLKYIIANLIRITDFKLYIQHPISNIQYPILKQQCIQVGYLPTYLHMYLRLSYILSMYLGNLTVSP